MIMMRVPLFAVLLLVNLRGVDALEDMKICYILDAILVVYGIVLTVLYVRLKLCPPKGPPPARPEKPDAGIYAGLTPHASDTYDIIRVEKKAQI